MTAWLQSRSPVFQIIDVGCRYRYNSKNTSPGVGVESAIMTKRLVGVRRTTNVG